MDKKILKEYEQACAIIRETKGRMIALREKGEDEVRQTVKDQLADSFIYASVSPTYLAGVIDIL